MEEIVFGNTFLQIIPFLDYTTINITRVYLPVICCGFYISQFTIIPLNLRRFVQ